MVLVTSRKAMGLGLGLVEPLHLGALPLDDSVKLLIQSAGSTVAWDMHEAMELVGICAYNALAISIVAGLIRNQYCSPKVRCPQTYIKLIYAHGVGANMVKGAACHLT